MRLILLIICSLATFVALAQKGTIRGSVIEDATGETVIGANIMVKDTQIGTITDLDGKFSLSLEPGTYTLQISYISYSTLTIEGIEVKAGEVTLLNEMRLQEENTELEEVIITAEAVRNTEAALLTMKQKAPAMMDGISASQIRLIGDATAVEAAKRVTGVSIEGGKYVYIRGLGDRYSKTMLNNVDIPGLDPDRNTLQMDIFPTNLIENITVTKNFTADLPADFTGGMLNIELKDFPEERIFDVSVGTSFNPSMHFNGDYLTYEGGSTDFLGFDDGTRELPAGVRGDVPQIFVAPDEEVNAFAQRFDPELGATRQTSGMNFSAAMTVGNQVELKSKAKIDESGENFMQVNPKLGYIFSLSYKSNVTYYDDYINAEYQRSLSDPSLTELTYANIQTGELSESNVLIGALGGLAYKTEFTKLRLTAMHLQNGESRAARFQIDDNGAAVGRSGFFAISDNLEYNQRSLSNILLNGKHVLGKSGWEIDWRVSPTFSISDDPDIRRTSFTRQEATGNFFFNAGAGGNPTRIWRDLSEINAVAKADVSKNYEFNGEDAVFKFGISHVYKQRDYEILIFNVVPRFSGTQVWEETDPNLVLQDRFLFPNAPNGMYYQSGNSNPNPNAYESNVHNTAFYVSNEFTPLTNLKTIIGVRAENYVQRHTGRDQTYASGDTENGNNLDNEKVLESLDLFPSLNLIYSLQEGHNIRASYTRTIARPSFKELSFAQILDPVSNRFFNGALFQYSDWDGNLTETRIDNIDLRWELFQEAGQLISISAFYKGFDKPIEMVRIPEQQTTTEFQPRNVGDGRLFGLELELRKNLEFITPSLGNFIFNSNVTLIESRIDMTETEFRSRKTFEREGQNIEDTREMAGQAPYVINAGLSYANYDAGMEAGFFYNVKGPTLTIVGVGLYPDVFSEPFHSLNFSINKRFGAKENTKIDFNVSNILNDRRELFFQSFEAQEQPFNGFDPGVTFSLGLSHSF